MSVEMKEYFPDSWDKRQTGRQKRYGTLWAGYVVRIYSNFGPEFHPSMGMGKLIGDFVLVKRLKKRGYLTNSCWEAYPLGGSPSHTRTIWARPEHVQSKPNKIKTPRGKKHVHAFEISYQDYPDLPASFVQTLVNNAQGLLAEKEVRYQLDAWTWIFGYLVREHAIQPVRKPGVIG